MVQPVSADELRGKAAPAMVDPNVKIPRAVLAAGERAAAIQQAVIGEAEPAVAQQLEGQPPPEQPSQPEQPPPQQAPPPVMPQPVAPQVPQQQPNWEADYKAMKGRYEKLVQDVSAVTEQNQRMRNEIASLRSVAPPANGHAAGPLNLLTEQEIADYGPEFIDVVRRAAAEIAAPLQSEVEQLRGQLGHVQQETGNAFLTRMNATIGGLVPNWEQLNNDPRFISWVNLPDIYSGVIRQQLMQDAWNSGEAHRVAAFFRAYLAEEAAVDPQAGQARGAQGYPPSLSPAPAAGTPGGVPLQTRLSLDTLVAPGRAHSAAQQPADKPFYTAQDITKFYTDVAAGKWRTREADRAAIDADIISAQHEGRIIPDNRTARPQNSFSGGR